MKPGVHVTTIYTGYILVSPIKIFTVHDLFLHDLSFVQPINLFITGSVLRSVKLDSWVRVRQLQLHSWNK